MEKVYVAKKGKIVYIEKGFVLCAWSGKGKYIFDTYHL